MISYHFLWDLVYLYNADIPWYKSHGAYIWQQSICWTFILLAGFSWHLGKKHMKRGLWAFGGGVVVSLVTAIVLPNDRVRYGVLTLIGSCILIWILLDKVLKKIPAGVGVSVSFVLFLILRSWTKQDPIQLSDNLLNVTWLKSVLAYIGLLWSSIFVTLMANKIGGLQFGIYRNCQISSRVFHTAVAALPLTKANRSDFE